MRPFRMPIGIYPEPGDGPVWGVNTLFTYLVAELEAA